MQTPTHSPDGNNFLIILIHFFFMIAASALSGTKENEGIGYIPTFPGSCGLNPQVALWVVRLVNRTSLHRLCNLLPIP